MCCRISELGFAQGSGVTRAWPTKCCCEHTHVCFRKKTPFIQGCTQGSKVVWGRPTNYCCKHTHVCVWQNHMSSQGLHQGSKRYKGLADQLLLRAYTYVCCRKNAGLNPSTKGCQGCGKPSAAYTCVCFRKTVQGCTQGSKVTRDWPTMCCCEHTHVCCRMYQFRVAPKCQGLQ